MRARAGLREPRRARRPGRAARAVVRVLAALASAGALASCSPLAMIPGVALTGTVEPYPSDWSFADSVYIFQLETLPEDPHSVNLRGAAAGEHFYVSAANPERRWGQNLLADSRARLRVGDHLYDVTAVLTDDPRELAGFFAAMMRKYDFEPDAERRALALLFRLDPR